MSGLQYANARVYDPQLGLFLSHDPARQFASPYTYTNWNPVNAVDPSGAFVAELITAMIVAAAVSAAVNTVVAAAQGMPLGQIGKAALTGAISGAVGVGLGVAMSAANIGISAAAGSLPQNVGLQQAVNALGEVAYRSAFSAVIANAAGQVAAAGGAPGWATMLTSAAAGYGGSYAYDSNFINYDGDLAQLEPKGAFRDVSNTETHTTVTAKAAEVAGFNKADTQAIVKGNLAQDLELANNQSHFGFGARDAFNQFASDAQATGNLGSVGAASHYIQDQYALGHMFLGTHLLAGPLGAPFRFIVHQTVGGEVNFSSVVGGLRIPSSFDATVGYFEATRSYLPSGVAL